MNFTDIIKIYNEYRSNCHDLHIEPTIFLTDAAKNPEQFQEQILEWYNCKKITDDLCNLKECPFCNDKAFTLNTKCQALNIYNVYLHCNNCDYTLSTFGSTREKAINKFIKIWNR